MKNMILILSSILLTLNTGCTNDEYGTVKIENHKNANTHIKEIFFKQNDSNSWGRNQLGKDELKPNESKIYTLKCQQEYDFRVIYLDDTLQYKRKEKLDCHRLLYLVFKD